MPGFHQRMRAGSSGGDFGLFSRRTRRTRHTNPVRARRRAAIAEVGIRQYKRLLRAAKGL